MSLTLRPDSNWWYGKFKENGARIVKNLNVKVVGTRPATLKETGDTLFERSRGEAQRAHDDYLGNLKNKRAGIKYAKGLLELVSEEKITSPLISSLTALWVKDKKLRTVQVGDKIRYEGLSQTHIRHATGKLTRLSKWMAKNHPNVKDMASMSKDQIEAYLKIIESYKLTACGWNSYLRLFREIFNRHEPGGRVARALKEMEFQKREVKHRKPFPDEQLLAILDAAKKYPDVEPLFILGVNTPLRLGGDGWC